MKRIIILILALFLLTATAYAQDADPGDTAPAATIEAVASEAAPVAPDTLPDAEAPAPNDGRVVLSVWQIIVGIISAISLGGIGGVAGAGVIAVRLRRDPSAIAAIEALGNSVPEGHSKVIVEITEKFTQSLNAVTALVVEALDRIPAASKTNTTAG